MQNCTNPFADCSKILENIKNTPLDLMSKPTLDSCVRDSLQTYFKDLGGEAPCNVYDMLIKTIEKPLLEVVMQHADQNQSKAAECLGLNRNTLRKKLIEHQLI